VIAGMRATRSSLGMTLSISFRGPLSSGPYTRTTDL
jgi:hypothetical protein